MLVLVRKTNQSVRIGENIELVVVGVQRGAVRLGFKAPPDVEIVRDDAINTQPKERER